MKQRKVNASIIQNGIPRLYVRRTGDRHGDSTDQFIAKYTTSNCGDYPVTSQLFSAAGFQV